MSVYVLSEGWLTYAALLEASVNAWRHPWLRRRAVGLIDSTPRVGDATMDPPSPLPVQGGR